MSGFIEVADRVWVARYPWWDANVTVVAGSAGLVVVDTHASTAAGRAVVADVRRLGAGEVTAVVNTHWHFDHTFGNAAFREAFPGVPIHATEEAQRNLVEWGEEARARRADDEDVLVAFDELTRRQVDDLCFGHARVVAEVEVLERAHLVEAGATQTKLELLGFAALDLVAE